jgi:hypothetical protein
MSKVEIDYSNTIIYKITCNDVNITDVYIGHTVNFVQRKYAHKQCSIKEQGKLYTTIRDNGGWDNWTMSIIHFFTCKNLYEARQTEQEYYKLLNGTLNSVEPMPEKPVHKEKTLHKETQIFYCENCDIHCNTLKSFEKHSNTINHKNNFLQNKILSQYSPFKCDICNFSTCNKHDYKKHCLTPKHINNTNDFLSNQIPKNSYTCECSKTYKYNQGLWKHKQTCDIINKTNTVDYSKNTDNNTENKNLTGLVLELINQNKELILHNQEIVSKCVDMCKNK